MKSLVGLVVFLCSLSTSVFASDLVVEGKPAEIMFNALSDVAKTGNWRIAQYGAWGGNVENVDQVDRASYSFLEVSTNAAIADLSCTRLEDKRNRKVAELTYKCLIGPIRNAVRSEFSGTEAQILFNMMRDLVNADSSLALVVGSSYQLNFDIGNLSCDEANCRMGNNERSE